MTRAYTAMIISMILCNESRIKDLPTEKSTPPTGYFDLKIGDLMPKEICPRRDNRSQLRTPERDNRSQQGLLMPKEICPMNGLKFPQGETSKIRLPNSRSIKDVQLLDEIAPTGRSETLVPKEICPAAVVEFQ